MWGSVAVRRKGVAICGGSNATGLKPASLRKRGTSSHDWAVSTVMRADSGDGQAMGQ